MKLVTDEFPPMRLKAAEALGRIGKPDVVPALLEGMRKGGDRFIEHALIFALVRINDPQSTRAALADSNPRVRQAGLIALDQMKDGNLTREQVVPLLDTDDPDLQQAVLEVMGRRPGWSGEVVGLLRIWLASKRLSAAQESSLTARALAFSTEANVQQLVAATLADERGLRRCDCFFCAVARSRVEPLPDGLAGSTGRGADTPGSVRHPRGGLRHQGAKRRRAGRQARRAQPEGPRARPNCALRRSIVSWPDGGNSPPKAFALCYPPTSPRKPSLYCAWPPPGHWARPCSAGRS